VFGHAVVDEADGTPPEDGQVVDPPDVPPRQDDFARQVLALVFRLLLPLLQDDDLRLAVKGEAPGDQVEGEVPEVGQFAGLVGRLYQMERRRAGLPFLETRRVSTCRSGRGPLLDSVRRLGAW
jgi:hypothetical protein